MNLQKHMPIILLIAVAAMSSIGIVVWMMR